MGSGFDIMAFVPFLLILGVLYFLVWRPQQQKMQKHQKMLANLHRGDRVLTSGGLIGTISKIVDNNEVQLEIADNIRIRQMRGMITDVLSKTDAINVADSQNSKATSKDVETSVAAKVRKATAPKKNIPVKAANRSTGKSKK